MTKLKTGDRVCKRGLAAVGTITKMDETWSTVEWDEGLKAKERPLMCHLNELDLEISVRNKQAQRLDDMCEITPHDIEAKVFREPMKFWKAKSPRQ